MGIHIAESRLDLHCLLANYNYICPSKPKERKVTYMHVVGNNAGPDQMPHHAESDQDLHC